jgi:hypothetical protein
MLDNVRQTKGITLLALVITVIVLLILAGVAINFAFTENGILKKTSQAKEAHKREQLREQLDLELVAIKMDKLTGANYSLEDIADILGGTVEDDEIIVEREGYIFSIKDLKIIDVSIANIAISFNPNGAKGVQLISTVLKVENKNKEVDPSSLQYGWSNAKDIQPTEWTSFTSGQTITKDITESPQLHFIWIKAKDIEGNELIKRSGQFNDIDNEEPTIFLSKTGDEVGSTRAEITAEVTYGFSGVASVKWQAGIKTIEDFVASGINITSPYKFTVAKNGYYTVCIEANNGKKAIDTIEVVNLIDAGWQAGRPNAPVLVEGMVPVYYNGNAWEVTEVTSLNWYNYIDNEIENATVSTTSQGQECRRWANVMLKDGTKKVYDVGTTYTDEELGSMLVWIPRYSYKITSKEHQATSAATAGTIAIKWSNNTADDTSDGYIAHPGFVFGTSQLKGIWVAKFEPSNNSTKPKIVPNATQWAHLTAGSAYTICRNMEKTDIYGWTAQAGTLNTDGSITGDSNNFDTHLVKSVEWGAIAYITHAVGKTGEVSTNTGYLTGGGNYKTNIAQSTTGSIYGIYDMAGGAYEHSMAVLNGNVGSSGLSVMPDLKYYDSYVVGSPSSSCDANYEANSNKKGDAIYETSTNAYGNSGWYGDYSGFMYYTPNNTWLLRSGFSDGGVGSGIFLFSANNGANTCSFRVILIVQ